MVDDKVRRRSFIAVSPVEESLMLDFCIYAGEARACSLLGMTASFEYNIIYVIDRSFT